MATATLDYIVPFTQQKPVVALAALAAIPLPTSDPTAAELLSLILPPIFDLVTVVPGTGYRRRIVYSLSPAFYLKFPTPASRVAALSDLFTQNIDQGFAAPCFPEPPAILPP